MSLVARITEPDVGRFLLRDEDEVVVDEVRRHWVVYVLPALESWAGAGADVRRAPS